MSEQETFQQISEYLREQRYSEEEIGRILAQLHEYELDTMVDSIMDSIGAGQEDIQVIIDQVLKEKQG